MNLLTYYVYCLSKWAFLDCMVAWSQVNFVTVYFALNARSETITKDIFHLSVCFASKTI
jgi:hypothetical protein